MLNFLKKFTGINCLILGDVNINLLNYDIDNDATRFLDILLNYGFSPFTLIPTRITASSSTLLDHIYWRQPLKLLNINHDKCLTGCLTTDITDHIANFICIPLNQNKNRPNKKDRPLIRVFSKINKAEFVKEFSSLDWSALVFNIQDVNESYSNFITNLKAIFEKCFPLVKLSRNRAKDKEWINDDLKKSCNKKSKYYKRWITTKDPNDLAVYKAYAKKHFKSISDAKKPSYQIVLTQKGTTLKSC